MTKEKNIRLMESKLRAFKNGYVKAVAREDDEAAEKWKEGCRSIYAEIDKLKED